MVGYSNDNKSLVYLETLTQAYAINPGIWYLVEGMSEYLSFICSSFVEGYSVDLSGLMVSLVERILELHRRSAHTPQEKEMFQCEIPLRGTSRIHRSGHRCLGLSVV